MVITKKLAARVQLETAITLWFNEGDPVSIHALATAANDCYHAIGGHSGNPSIYQTWLGTQSEGFKKRAREAQNFFKHGRIKLHGEVELILIDTEILIADSTVCHEAVFSSTTPLMRLYVFRFMLENPDIAILGARHAPSLDRVEIKNLANLKRRDFLEEVLPSLIRAESASG